MKKDEKYYKEVGYDIDKCVANMLTKLGWMSQQTALNSRLRFRFLPSSEAKYTPNTLITPAKSSTCQLTQRASCALGFAH